MENIETLLAAVAQTQGFDDDPVAAPVPSAKVENSDSRRRNSGGVQPPIGESSGNAPPSSVVDAVHPPAQTICAGVKRKRGRPPKGQAAAKPPPPKREKLEEEEEDVCFICFDGGSLVLCDRKGCPKAYHPSCIKRDEAFFASNAKWICGWHICSVCMKASHYMCYTCTYSLCKGCVKNADYVCVRGNKGFCSTCMKTIMLIENKGQANDQLVQVDFDDKTSWEYLFKVYWVLLKEKLSLPFTELAQAKPPLKAAPSVFNNQQSNNELSARVDGNVSSSSTRSGHLKLNTPRVETSLLQNDMFSSVSSSIDIHVDKLSCNDTAGGSSHNDVNAKPMSGIEKIPDRPWDAKEKTEQYIGKNTIKKETEWASKDLLEFVTFVRNGDASAMSQSDVQTLLLDYINRNGLWDKKRQIICDQRLRNLFGKPRVSHNQMLKLLELHFLMEDSQKNSSFPAGIVTNNLEAAGSISGTKRKIQEKNEERVPQNNIEYAAIDVHNIKLVYLGRDLMENLLEDQENFNNKVIGSIVRIRTMSLNQKLDIYRLVQVVGTIKVAKPYKVGGRTANVKLEVLNLDEKEIVSIDAISNEEFTEDECRRLRKSIRCGLVKHLTVGEIQKVAVALQPVRINYLLKAEILRLNHLQDQASKNEHKKEHKEYLERLELLKSPEEWRRRIAEVPEIHADPRMSMNYESEEEGNNNKKVELVHPRYPGLAQNGRNSVSPNKRGKDHSIRSQNRVTPKINANGAHKINANGTPKIETPIDQVNVTNSEAGGKNDRAIQSTGLETSTTTTSVANSPSVNDNETEKLWHYRDPNGQIQGPFSMRHMRIWNTTGLLPPDMRIWTNHEQDKTMLLTDALKDGGSESSCKQSLGSQENWTSGGNGESEGTNGNSGDSKQTEAVGSNHSSVVSEKISGHVKENETCGDSEGSNGTSGDSKQTEAVGSNHLSLVSEKISGRANENGIGEDSDGTNGTSGDSKQTEAVRSNHPSVVSEKISGRVKENGTSGDSDGTNGTGGDSKQTEAVGSNHSSVVSEKISGRVKENGPGGDGEGSNGTSGDIKQTEAVGSNHSSDASEKISRRVKENGTSGDSEATKGTSGNSKQTEAVGSNHSCVVSEEISEHVKENGTSGDSKQTDAVGSNHASVVSEKNSGHVKENASDSSWPQCWDLLNDKNSGANDVQANERCKESDELNHGSENGDKKLNDLAQEHMSSEDEFQNQCKNEDRAEQMSSGNELQNQCKNEDRAEQMSSGNELQNLYKNEDRAAQPTEENSRSLNVDLSSNFMESESVAPVSNSLDLNKKIGNVDLSDHQSPTPTNAENQPSVSGVLELLGPTLRLNNEDETETKPSGTLNFPVLDTGLSWSSAPNVVASGVQLPSVGNEWSRYSSTLVKPSVLEWDSGLVPAPLLKTEVMDEYPAAPILDGHQISQAPPPEPPASNMPNWLAMLNEPIEFDALGEESVSDLLAEVDAMESQGAIHSPNAAIRFAREFLEECKDDCFSSMENFNPIPDLLQRCDASGSTGEMQMTSQSSCNPIETYDAIDSFKKSSVNSSAASSEDRTNAQVHSGDAVSEFHPPAPSNPAQDMVGHPTTATSSGSDPVDPGWGNVQGNINLVTVQGNVNLVLGGPAQGMTNLNWGTNPGNTWVNPSINQSPRNGSLPWDSGQQRKYGGGSGGERYTSPRSSYQGNEPGFRRPPRGRQGYSGGGFSRPPPKVQRVCKFYESGHCKKGAFCDYLHP